MMSFRKIYETMTGVTLAAALLVCASVGYGADTGTDADSLLVDLQVGGVTFSTEADGSITISFSAQSTRSPVAFSCGSTVADVGVSEGAFVGDYIAAGVKSLTFKITGDGHVPGSARVVLKNKDGRAWYNPNVEVSAVAGTATVNTISFDRTAGWERNERPGVDKDAMWAEDLRNVAVIGISLTQGGIEAQSYTIGDFMLVDQYGGTSGAATLTPLEQALLDAFGVTDVAALSDEQKLRDLDGDGMTDLYEIRSELEEGFADSIFAAEIVAIESDGITIKWPCVAGEKYTVFRAPNLSMVFEPLAGAKKLEATETGYMTHKDTSATGSGPYFYRILKQKP